MGRKKTTTAFALKRSANNLKPPTTHISADFEAAQHGNIFRYVATRSHSSSRRGGFTSPRGEKNSFVDASKVIIVQMPLRRSGKLCSNDFGQQTTWIAWEFFSLLKGCAWWKNHAINLSPVSRSSRGSVPGVTVIVRPSTVSLGLFFHLTALLSQELST